MRTQEQIIADCEKRFAELQAERDHREADPLVQRPCNLCRFRVDHNCKEPLVRGFGAPLPNVDWQIAELNHLDGELSNNWPHVKLCGKEKALWQPHRKPQPKLTLWQRIINFLKEPTNG